MLYYVTIALTIGSSILYHLFLKITPGSINPMFSLAITYFVACLTTLALYPFYPVDKVIPFLDNFKEVNWVSYALGIAIVGLEVGTLVAYRVGWNISLFNIVASTTVSVLLIPIGLLLFKESLSLTTILGLVLCLLGLVLINCR